MTRMVSFYTWICNYPRHTYLCKCLHESRPNHYIFTCVCVNSYIRVFKRVCVKQWFITTYNWCQKKMFVTTYNVSWIKGFWGIQFFYIAAATNFCYVFWATISYLISYFKVFHKQIILHELPYILGVWKKKI